MDEPAKNILQTAVDHLPRSNIEDLFVPTDSAMARPTPAIYALRGDMVQINLTAEIDKVATQLQPWRRKGTAKLQDLQGLIDWANRNKGDTSVLFADTGAQPGLTCIADYMAGGPPLIDPSTRDPSASHMFHRATYAFPLSDEWKIWSKVSGEMLTKGQLGEFVEANAKDLLDPTPNLLADTPGARGVEDWEVRMIEIARQLQGRFGQYQTLMQMARSFQINETSNLTTTLNRDTGESSIQFLNEHQQPDGSPMLVPNLFMIAIPIFDRGHAYRLAVRFRYRKQGSEVKFVFTLHNPDLAFDDAVEEALDGATQGTGLPLFRGTPEG